MTAFWKWILGGLLVFLSGVALALHYMSGQKIKSLGTFAVSAIEAAHAPKIAELNKQLVELQKDSDINERQIIATKAVIVQKKIALSSTYKSAGLSEQEIVDRLQKL